MKCFVTGSTGLVGSYLLIQLLKDNHEVTALYRSDKKRKLLSDLFKIFKAEEFLKKVVWVSGDINQPEGYREAMLQADVVFHCAAMVSFVPSDRDRMYKVNIEGTRNVVNTLLEKEDAHLVYVSSVAAVGKSIDKAKHSCEDDQWEKSDNYSYYAISKHQSEMEVWRGMEEGLQAVIVNPSIILGVGISDQSSSSIFYQAQKGIPFYPTGSNSFIDVRDVVKIMIRLSQNKTTGERFILTSENMKYREFLNHLSEVFGHKPPHIRVTKFIGELGWRLDKIRAFISGKQPLLTKEAIRSAREDMTFSNDKILREFSCELIPIQRSVLEFREILKGL